MCFGGVGVPQLVDADIDARCGIEVLRVKTLDMRSLFAATSVWA